MENLILNTGESKPDIESGKTLCRCCLSTDRRMWNSTLFEVYFQDLAGISVSQSDGLPQWVCYECTILLYKAVRFKHKLLRAHNLLYEYLTRCAPFPIDAQDPELVKYASPNLSATTTLSFDVSGKTKLGFQKTLQHEKQIKKTELDLLELPILAVNKADDDHQYEDKFSDFEDNITLEQYRTSTNKVDNELTEILEMPENVDVEVKKKKKLKKKEKTKKKKTSDADVNDPTTEAIEKPSIRKQLDLDPTKIRLVILNPQEQIKQREEESKASLKFPFQCHLCFKGFNFDSKLRNHMTKHSPSRGTFECKLCHMYLPTSYSYSVHNLIHTRRYECMKCFRRMTDKASIVDHYRTQHEQLIIISYYEFDVCLSCCSNCKTHRGHMRNHHSGDRPKCDQCGKTFVNNDSLAEHLQIHQGIKNYECSICNKRFRTRTQIKHHQLRHSDVKEYYCVECDTRFKSAHNLRQHLLKSLKHKDKQSLKYPCGRAGCPRRFACARAAEQHARVQHDGARPHACARCGAALASRASLHKHERAVHRGLRPPPRHVCHTCGRAFRGKSVLVNHVRTHTVKPEAPKDIATEPRDPKIDLYTKEDQPIEFENWNRPQMGACDVYFQVTAGH
ncbi:zinc finger protein interacting with ribonucleoprotein K-like [Achroia grisella]|uniref:zinc finger protein interacting with ribonucleoprotein K-like n=1 Tax=Achroia grisella TaxID=688607 RepID=UPI0027D28E69|nr:zinc finger protein interacting with ribonucleoprotein K-like [Achroia grisella]